MSARNTRCPPYQAFCGALRKSATTHAGVFATLHTEATCLLMDLLEETGLNTFVGKVNMDRNSPAYLTQTTQESVAETEEWLRRTRNRFMRTKPILTPRFVPTCSEELMAALGKMARADGLPVQSHLSESRAEIEWVKKLHPDCEGYGAVYDKYGLFGGDVPTIMAHCVYPTEEEFDLIRERGVMLAHCPQVQYKHFQRYRPGARHARPGAQGRSGERRCRWVFPVDFQGGLGRHPGFKALRGPGGSGKETAHTAGGVSYGDKGRRQLLGEGREL